ncbi:hypothetical protein H0H93_010256 [Arthromyces matolae]|nr:hypothetical protein H0H93_010256 [Arthromyces matolae]
MQLLDIPDEILLHILSFLELSDVATLSAVHSGLHSIVKSSSSTQFRFAASRACVEPTACRAYGAGDRLSALLSLEDGWEKLQFNFRRSIPVLHKPSGLYDLTAGVWVLGDEDMQTLHVCNLPSSPNDKEIEWRKITTGCHVVDFGLAIHEHDLIVIRPLKPFLYIGLPHLSPDYVLLSTQCRAEPNPSPSGTPHSHQPFHPKAEDSVVIFTLRGLDRLTMQLSAFTMFVHRRALLDVILQRRLDYAPDAIYAHRLAHVSWQIWGPGSTRLFEVPDSSTSWITTTAGQRCVIGLTRDLETGLQKVTVLDFNPHFVRKMLERRFEETASSSSPTVVVEESVIEHAMFDSPVKTSLPYVSGILKFETDANISFKAILLDEERLLGITEVSLAVIVVKMAS